MTDTLINDVMTSSLLTVTYEQSMHKVDEIFIEHNIHHIPVVKGDELVGIISRTDVDKMKHGKSFFVNTNASSYNAALFEATLAKDVMTKHVQTIKATDSIFLAYSWFKNNEFRALPVVNENKLIGIITPIDILDHFFAKQNNG